MVARKQLGGLTLDDYGGGRSGSFAAGGSGKKKNSSRSGGDGGYGWYGGGGGGVGNNYSSDSPVYAGGGGSGFIIGVSTTTYPSGYLEDNTDLQATIASAISEGTLTQGVSTETSSKMLLTILDLPNSTRNIHYYDGTQFVEAEVYRYNGTLFERVEPKIYTNSQWQ